MAGLYAAARVRRVAAIENRQLFEGFVVPWPHLARRRAIVVRLGCRARRRQGQQIVAEVLAHLVLTARHLEIHVLRRTACGIWSRSPASESSPPEHPEQRAASERDLAETSHFLSAYTALASEVNRAAGSCLVAVVNCADWQDAL